MKGGWIMIIFKNKDRAIMLGKVLEVIPGEGRAVDWKKSVHLQVANDAGRTRDFMLDFWNSKDKTKPQMATKAGHLSPGDSIICLVIYKNGEYTCLAMLKDEGMLYFDYNGTTMYLLYGNLKIDKTPGEIFKVAIPFHYKDEKRWNVVGFEGNDIDKAKRALMGCQKAILIADERREGKTKIGLPVVKYKGVRAYAAGGNNISSIEINIGLYRKNPTKLGDLIKKSPGRKKDVMYWMKYVAEVWDAQTESEKLQKRAITEYLEAM